MKKILKKEILKFIKTYLVMVVFVLILCVYKKSFILLTVLILFFIFFTLKYYKLYYKSLKIPKNLYEEIDKESKNIIYHSYDKYVLLDSYIIIIKNFRVIKYDDIKKVEFFGLPRPWVKYERVYMYIETKKDKTSVLYCIKDLSGNKRECYKEIEKFLLEKNPQIKIKKNDWEV